MTAMLEIARVNVLRMLRDRMGLFFVFLLPLILIVVLGTVFGGRVAPRLGIVATGAGPLGDELVAAIGRSDLRLEITSRETQDQLRGAVEEGSLELGLVIPPGYDGTLRAGDTATVTLLGPPSSVLSALREGVAAAVAEQSALVRAARLSEAHAGVDFQTALIAARDTRSTLPGATVSVSSVGESVFPTDAGPFSLGAQSQLVLFMFLTSMTAATQLILTRQLGVSRRMLSTPTPIRAILLGELLGRFGVAMVQGVFIVLVSALVFNVGWGDLAGATTLVVAFALVGTGAAMVIGTFASNPDQAGTVGVFAGMALGALGGAMVPLELFGEPMATIARVTPHSWAIEGFRDLAFHGAGIGDILLPLGVLAAMAIGLIALGSWGLRRTLTHG